MTDPNMPETGAETCRNDTAETVAQRLAAALVALADATEPRPVTAGPVGLPDLVCALTRLARETPRFAQRAMLGEISPEQWRELGRIHLELGRRCLALAAVIPALGAR